jgi:hypothetical protein
LSTQIERGDRIEKVNGNRIGSISVLETITEEQVWKKAPITVNFIKPTGKRASVRVSPRDPAFHRTGGELINQLGAYLRKVDGGLLVTYLRVNSPADKAQVLRGDVITEVNGKPIPAEEHEISKLFQQASRYEFKVTSIDPNASGQAVSRVVTIEPQTIEPDKQKSQQIGRAKGKRQQAKPAQREAKPQPASRTKAAAKSKERAPLAKKAQKKSPSPSVSFSSRPPARVDTPRSGGAPILP